MIKQQEIKTLLIYESTLSLGILVVTNKKYVTQFDNSRIIGKSFLLQSMQNKNAMFNQKKCIMILLISFS